MGEFSPFCKRYFEKKIPSQTPCFSPQNKSPEIATIAYNMKGCFIFSTFIFSILSNLANILVDNCHLSNITKFIKKTVVRVTISVTCLLGTFIFFGLRFKLGLEFKVKVRFCRHLTIS